MPERLKVVRADDGAEIAGLLAAAFAEDPILGWLLPAPRNTYSARRRLFGQALRVFMRDGVVEATAGGEAAAIWGSPHRVRPGRVTRAVDNIRGLFATLLSAGPAIGRSTRLNRTMRRYHPHDTHWYLSALGTLSGARRRGAASSLLEERLAVCDQEGVQAYLESSNPANLPLYERHGFEIIRQISVDDSPPLWLMTRPPHRQIFES